VYFSHDNVFAEPLPSNCSKGTHTDTYWWEGFMKYDVEMSPDAMMYIPNSVKTGSGIQKLIRGNSQAHR
jgi:hypothetical protein